ncbi:MAG: site-specific integrase [Myxococcota bacterium]
MYEALLPEHLRSRYRDSQHRKRVDQHAARLLKRGYSPRVVAQYLREWLDFLMEYEARNAPLPEVLDGPEVVAYLARRFGARGRRTEARRALRHLLDGGDASGRGPHRREQGPTPLQRVHLPAFLAFLRHHRGRRTTCQPEACLVRFFMWWDQGQHDAISEITVEDVRGFLRSLAHLSPASIATYSSALRGFFRYLHLNGQIAASVIYAVEGPPQYRLAHPPPVLEEAMVEQLVSSVDHSTALGKRDRAMLLLAARYGLRPCDIRGLQLENIRWRDQRIVLRQSKTQRELELPLLADVDEALVLYLREARPTSDAREIFVRHRPPFQALNGANNLWSVMDRAWRSAGFPDSTSPRGMYLLRHSLATMMLRREVPMLTISGVLGHTSSDVTHKYLQVDLDHLREVALFEGEVRQ